MQILGKHSLGSLVTVVIVFGLATNLVMTRASAQQHSDSDLVAGLNGAVYEQWFHYRNGSDAHLTITIHGSMAVYYFHMNDVNCRAPCTVPDTNKTYGISGRTFRESCTNYYQGCS